MKCFVCYASWPDASGSICPQCGYDVAAEGANDPRRIESSRSAFRDKTLAYAPASRVTTLDKLKPWLALLLGMVLFVFWLRACFSGGRF
jgi:hypothetical protein